eukprot:764295-Hanusia_phi.AAC.1
MPVVTIRSSEAGMREFLSLSHSRLLFLEANSCPPRSMTPPRRGPGVPRRHTDSRPGPIGSPGTHWPGTGPSQFCMGQGPLSSRP